MSEPCYIHQLSDPGLQDIPQVLAGSGVHVPDGFVVTAGAYRYYLEAADKKT